MKGTPLPPRVLAGPPCRRNAERAPLFRMEPAGVESSPPAPGGSVRVRRLRPPSSTVRRGAWEPARSDVRRRTRRSVVKAFPLRMPGSRSRAGRRFHRAAGPSCVRRIVPSYLSHSVSDASDRACPHFLRLHGACHRSKRGAGGRMRSVQETRNPLP